ncbi:HtaA domain-containing protein [Conexibacter woesei]|uniref:Htaa domain protein n=1 Tax=Conexibacter woesei (strain DSM 14684 / CCUG 47730 / CIP 108061 / JCM 11494 / NBRC 100937 / ID131577) TaxID=469383 RepID=D3F0U6_CONWI|nr:HtaA domain-containing protein [Conexibacter woesei]ADB54030.1 Htaa domain protein [Conexibacter woesei DSM 14684]
MTSRTSRSRRPLLVAFLSILLAGLAASAARATDPPPEPITAGTVEWGVKESFRTYVVGGIARGSITLDGGVSRTPAGTFSFPVNGGVFDPGINGTVANTAGNVRMTGHGGTLDMRISDLRVELLPEGAVLRADVRSAQRDGGEPIDTPDVVLADLDISAVSPVTAGGVTTWSRIPATLTRAGAPAFGGFYRMGESLDPVTFSYEGNGGKPVPENFTAPATNFFARTDSDTPGKGNVFHDVTRGLVHKAGSDAVNAVDAVTLETRGTPLAHGLVDDDQIVATAFDADAGRIFASHRNGRASVYTWTGDTYTHEALPGTHGVGLVALAGGKAYFAAEDQGTNPVVTVVSGGPGAWTASTYPEVDTGGLPFRALAALPDGRLVATVRYRVAGGAVPQAALLLTDTGSGFTATAIEGTALPRAQPGETITLGYDGIQPGPNGSLLLSETPLRGPMRVQRLRFDGSGATVDGPPLVLERTQDWTVNQYTGRLVLVFGTSNVPEARIDVLEPDGELFASFRGLQVAWIAAAADDTLYVADNGDAQLTVKLQLAGVSPTVTGEPQDAAVELPGAGATGTATFTAAADATPAATVQWQRRPLGVTRWSDVAGATATTLSVDAAQADNGTRYRAVFENGGGRIGTRPATLTVTAAPPRPPVDQPRTPADQPRTPARESPRTPIGKDAVAKRLPRGTITVPRGTRSASRGGVVQVATISCPRGAACRVAVPKQVRVRIGGRSFQARVLAPARVASGRRAAVRVKLPRAAARRLAGRSATVAVNVTVSADGWKALTRTATVRVRAAAVARR